VESQQQSVGPLRTSPLNANGRACAVVARGGARDQILVIELDPSVGKQLRLKGDSITVGAAAKEPDLVPLDGQMLSWPRAQNLEEDVRPWDATSRVQVVPERSDGCFGWKSREIGVYEGGVARSESH